MTIGDFYGMSGSDRIPYYRTIVVLRPGVASSGSSNGRGDHTVVLFLIFYSRLRERSNKTSTAVGMIGLDKGVIIIIPL